MRRASLVAISVLLVVVLCGCMGPDDGRHVALFGIRFRNDLTHRIVLVACNTDGGARCDLIREPHPVDPGKQYSDGIAPGGRELWAVEAPDGRKLRCVNLHWVRYPGFIPLVSLSRAPPWTTPCPESPSQISR
jgi:hypothetical protein